MKSSLSCRQFVGLTGGSRKFCPPQMTLQSNSLENKAASMPSVFSSLYAGNGRPENQTQWLFWDALRCSSPFSSITDTNYRVSSILCLQNTCWSLFGYKQLEEINSFSNPTSSSSVRKPGLGETLGTFCQPLLLVSEQENKTAANLCSKG